MPSPFPGMDPFLEHPAIFPGLHDRLIAYLSESLQAELPDPYYAEISDRVWVELTRRMIGPDVKVLQRDDAGPIDVSHRAASATAVAEPVVVSVPQDEHREPLLQIFSAIEGERLVTTVEVLSLTNKMPGEKGRDLYQRKQQEILDSQTNLVEIDLLRGGQHTTAVPLDWALERTGPFDYHVCVHRFDLWEDFYVYPIRLSQRLTHIAIPLLPGDDDVKIDLQAVFNRCYDTGPYRRRVRYATDVIQPPLTDEQAKWAAEVLSNSKRM